MNKLFATGVILLFFSLTSFSQVEDCITTNLILKGTDYSTYQKYFSNEMIDIEVIKKECDPKFGYDVENVYFRITNKSKKEIDLSWYMDKYYREICTTCEHPDEYFFKLSLKPLEVLEGTCDMECDYRLKIYSKFTDPQYTGTKAQLTSFQFRQLQIQLR